MKHAFQIVVISSASLLASACDVHSDGVEGVDLDGKGSSEEAVVDEQALVPEEEGESCFSGPELSSLSGDVGVRRRSAPDLAGDIEVVGSSESVDVDKSGGEPRWGEFSQTVEYCQVSTGLCGVVEGRVDAVSGVLTVQYAFGGESVSVSVGQDRIAHVSVGGGAPFSLSEEDIAALSGDYGLALPGSPGLALAALGAVPVVGFDLDDPSVRISCAQGAFLATAAGGLIGAIAGGLLGGPAGALAGAERGLTWAGFASGAVCLA